jgi:hypothetical protein
MTIEEKVLQLKQDFDEVYEAGKQAEYEAFWDAYQENGNKTNYRFAFAGNSWTAELFKPKYDIRPTGIDSYMMFYFSEISGDLVQILENCGVEMDMSSLVGWVQYTFCQSKITRLGKIDLHNASMLASTFSGTPLHTIDELVVSKTNGFDGTFNGCVDLENLTISGTIGQSGFDVHWSTKLSKASIESIIGHLDVTEGRPATSITLSLTAVNKAFETSEGANNGADSDEFNNLCASARAFGNWTISLV